MSQLSVETEDTFATLLELAANNDIEGFKKAIETDPCNVDQVGLWYGRQKGSKQMVLEHRTPLMVAAMYGSIDVLKLILSLSKADVNQLCGVDKTSALHCAASGGSSNAVEIVRLLLLAGADKNLIDVNGLRPVDVIVVSPKFPDMKKSLEDVLRVDGEITVLPLPEGEITVLPLPEGEITVLPLPEPDPEPEPENDPESDLVCSLKALTFADPKREYPVDPSLPDIKNSIYSTDEFRMYSFKVRPCSRAYSHDWTECPFVHPGENARRRDPRKYHYSCVPCPDFRKGACRRGDMCEYAHGVFECWLHPAQYRTRLCKDGSGCNRRVCFFAHKQDELRPLFVSTGSAVPSPRAGSGSGPSALDFMIPGPGNPGPGNLSPSFTPPMSPNANGIGNWAQASIPALHLPGSNLQSSRLRSSLNARDLDQELNMQLLNELNRQQQRSVLTPTKLDDIFAAESSSPRFSDHQSVFSPRHNVSVFNQFQLSPINTTFSPKNTAFSVQSVQSVQSPRSVDPISPMGSRVSMLARENHNQNHHQFRSLSSRELGSGLGVDPWSKWGSGNEKAEWGVGNSIGPDEYGKLRRSSSFENSANNSNVEEPEPDLSWVQSLVKETPPERMEKMEKMSFGEGSSGGGGGERLNMQTDQFDQSAWIEQMQLEKLIAQQN